MTLFQRPARSVLLCCLLGVFAGCGQRREATLPGQLAKGPSMAPGADGDACGRICEASAACGDSSDRCMARCNEWLIKRSRPGIATATARCAVPRIDDACESEETRGAAHALVSCVDEAGRSALVSDKTTLVVAARAICERGARCSGGSVTEAAACVQRIVNAPAAPKGLGIFGAIKPALVSEFAACLQSSVCGAAGTACFGAMLGETGLGGKGAPPLPQAPGGDPEPPSPPAAPPPGTGGTKI